MLRDDRICQGSLAPFYGNSNAFIMLHPPAHLSCTKHSDFHHYFPCGHVDIEDVFTEHISIEKQPADILSIVLDAQRLEALRELLSLGLLEN